MKKEHYLIAIGALLLVAVLFVSGGVANNSLAGSNTSHGFYSADYAEPAATDDWYVASNTPLRSGTA